MHEGKGEARFPTFQGNSEDDFSLWERSEKAVLRGKDLTRAPIEDTVVMKVSEKVLFMIISALGDNLSRSIQECETMKDTWNKLQPRYGQALIKKLRLLNNMLNKRFKQGKNMSDYVAKLKSQFSQLASMGCIIKGTMKVAILI